MGVRLANCRFAALSALVLLVFSAVIVAPSLAAYAGAKGEGKAEKFIEIAEKARETALRLNETAVSMDVDVAATDVPALIESGDLYLSWARGNLTVDDEAAFSNAREAQAEYRDAIKILSELLGEDDVCSEECAEERLRERVRDMFTAVNRTMEQVQRLLDVNMSIADTPQTEEYREWFRGNLSDAEAHLEQAMVAVRMVPPNMTWAAGNLSLAKNEVSEAFKALRMMENWVFSWRVEAFLNGVKKTVARTDEHLDREARKWSIDVAPYKDRLQALNGLIESAREKALEGDKKGAVEDLQQFRSEVNSITKDLKEFIKTERSNPSP